VKQYQKKVVIILSKIDNLDNPDQLGEIQTFVKENFSKLTGTKDEPIIFPVSSKQALEAKSMC
jgi:translation elongation factor EF-Tu-like GTPase